MILSIAHDEVIGTLKVTLKGFTAYDNEGWLIARSWRLRKVGREVEAYVERKQAFFANRLPLPF